MEAFGPKGTGLTARRDWHFHRHHIVDANKKARAMDNLNDVAAELRSLDSQFVHQRDNVFAKMALQVENAIRTIKLIDQTLSVGAAEYVPAIQDVFTIIDSMHLLDAAKESEG